MKRALLSFVLLLTTLSVPASAIEITFTDNVSYAFKASIGPNAYSYINSDNVDKGVSSVLGKCVSETELDCIESIEVSTDSKKWSPLTFKSYAPLPKSELFSYGSPRTWARYASYQVDNPVLGIPNSYSTSSWSSSLPDNSEYAVTVSSQGTMASPTSKANWRFFGLKVEPAKPTDTLNKDLRFKFKIRFNYLAPVVSGWFGGRVLTPALAVSTTQSGGKVATFTGGVMSVNQVSVEIPYEIYLPIYLTLYPELANIPSKLPTKTGKKAVSPNNPKTIQHWELLDNKMPQKAAKTQNYWSFERLENQVASTQIAGCSSADQISGVLSTNATAFELKPPTWNPELQSLDFKVASSHLDASGKVTQGFYSLLVPQNVAECLWSNNLSSNKAQISITDANGDTKVITESVKIADGNLNFHIAGFTYSIKRISVGVGDKKLAKAQITCIKGKQVKKIAGAKCPKGFKVR